MTGPLAGVRVIEVAGLGAAPFCGMMLGDMGAEVIRVDRIGPVALRIPNDPLERNRRCVAIDLKTAGGVGVFLRLVGTADAVFEGFRPGVAERLGIGPAACMDINPKLVYGRLTGWGQDGPLAPAAGHDINYLALSGALAAIGRAGEPPVPPLNLMADFGGGGLLMAFGMVCGLFEAARSGQGQVIDAAMLDGSIALMAMFHGLRALGLFDGQAGTHFLSGAAHFYGTYETSDGKYVAIASIEPQFYAKLIEVMGLDRTRFAPGALRLPLDRRAQAQWGELREELASIFRTRTRDEWCALLDGVDVCFAPVLTLDEARGHPHNRARQSFVDIGGVMQNAPAPRFSRTAAGHPTPQRRPGEDTVEVLRSAGFSPDEIRALEASKVILQVR